MVASTNFLVSSKFPQHNCQHRLLLSLLLLLISITLPRFLQREGKVRMENHNVKRKPLMLHCFVSLLSLTSYKKKMFFAGRKCYSFNTQFSVFTGDCMPLLYSMCVFVKWKFQFVTGGNWKSSKRHASLYSIFFGSLKTLPCIFCTNQTKQKRYIWT